MEWVLAICMIFAVMVLLALLPSWRTGAKQFEPLNRRIK